jgi:hypothetical protein
MIRSDRDKRDASKHMCPTAANATKPFLSAGDILLACTKLFFFATDISVIQQ